jgi:hypothetical protein
MWRDVGLIDAAVGWELSLCLLALLFFLEIHLGSMSVISLELSFDSYSFFFDSASGVLVYSPLSFLQYFYAFPGSMSVISLGLSRDGYFLLTRQMVC